MKKTYLVFMTLGLGLIMSSLGWAAMDWQIMYQTDFATNKGWETNNATNYYLDSSVSVEPPAYHAKMVNINFGGEYACYHVGPTAGSFRLTWDMRVNALEGVGGLSFGLYSEGLESSKPPSNFAEITFGSEDRGQLIFLNWSDTDGYGRDYSLSDPFELGTSYRLAMEYNADTLKLTAGVTRVDTGDFFELSCTGVGPFDSDMGYLGISNVRDGIFQCPGCWGEGYVDNIVFEVPEPATLLLLGLGGLVLRRRGR